MNDFGNQICLKELIISKVLQQSMVTHGVQLAQAAIKLKDSQVQLSKISAIVGNDLTIVSGEILFELTYIDLEGVCCQECFLWQTSILLKTPGSKPEMEARVKWSLEKSLLQLVGEWYLEVTLIFCWQVLVIEEIEAICKEEHFIEMAELVVTNSSGAKTDWVDVSTIQTISVIVHNVDTQPVRFYLEGSPDRQMLVQNSSEITLIPDEVRVLLPKYFMKYLRIVIFSDSVGKKIDYWIQGR